MLQANNSSAQNCPFKRSSLGVSALEIFDEHVLELSNDLPACFSGPWCICRLIPARQNEADTQHISGHAGLCNRT
jgi:hypothetical protein